MYLKKSKNERGWISVYKPSHPFSRPSNGYISLHRLLLEDFLIKNDPNNKYLIKYKGKKYLNPKCHVHHKNGIRNDNRIENLEPVTPGHHNIIHKTKYRINKEQLKELYINQKLSSEQIAKKFNCDGQTILNKLHRYNIQLRPPSCYNVRDGSGKFKKRN